MTESQVLDDVVFLFTARRTGGTALAHAFEKNGFHLFFDPLNPALQDLASAVEIDSNSWESKHPNGMRYFSNYAEISSADIPLDLQRLNTEWLQPSTAEYEIIKNYFLLLLRIGRLSRKPVCFKIEEISIYQMLKSEFPNATFVGLVRDRESHLESYANQILAEDNASFFESDLISRQKHMDLNGAKIQDIDSTDYFAQPLIAAFDWARTYHEAFVNDNCDLIIELNKGAIVPSNKSSRCINPKINNSLHTFKGTTPDHEMGINLSKILDKRLSLLSERDVLLSERDVLLSERDVLLSERDVLLSERDVLLKSLSWRFTGPARKIIGLFK